MIAGRGSSIRLIRDATSRIRQGSKSSDSSLYARVAEAVLIEKISRQHDDSRYETRPPLALARCLRSGDQVSIARYSVHPRDVNKTGPIQAPIRAGR